MASLRASRTLLSASACLLLLAPTALHAQAQKDVWKTPDPAPVGKPNADDLVWEKAVAKYDGPRAKLDHDVNVMDGKGPFAPNWSSLEKYQIPSWYQDAKFGIFIHFGNYSTPEFGNEWYPRNMYLEGTKEYKHQTDTYGAETKFGYKDFLPMFKAEGFNAKQWADLFKESGARYVIPVAEHHDGFPMYNSDLTDWSAAKMGPKRDVIGELRTAILADGLHFGASSHRAEHYFFLNGGRAHPSDVQDPKYAAFYGPAHVGPDPLKDQTGHPDPAYLNDWLARSAEIVEKYHPELIYFDWWIEQPEFQPYLKRFAAFYYNQASEHGQKVVLFRKNDAFPPHTTVMDIERGQADKIQPEHWQTDTPVTNESWGYIKGDTYKRPDTILWQLIDIVSKNGNLLLDVGPKPDGTITPETQSVLRALGDWLHRNGEAIYGTHAWSTYGEGPTQLVSGSFNDAKLKPYTAQDFRFTAKGSALYATAMGWPKDGKLLIHTLGNASGFHVAHATMVGSTAAVPFHQTKDGLELSVFGQAPAGLPAYSFKLTQ
ncbi:alpha-L-fucosidase [Acidipila sp. EB88]|uniref:alpha-L-fucosidase n=1 Tax=Acidipila sp. EB88 TaxID=2305226 RepID=UPI000F5E5AD7|nr:alpha-L-fucosidase [Acidipila sp. EB88]RRA47485.1 alpha-L-fucosidase [Acidipila sp. EB88]